MAPPTVAFSKPPEPGIVSPTPAKSTPLPDELTLAPTAAGTPLPPTPALARARQKPAPQPPSLVIPAILMEGDEPSRSHLSGPGMKYAVAPSLSPASQEPLPEPRFRPPGQVRLHLLARDPWCLYAHWDLAAEEQLRHNALAKDHHLILRVRPLSEIGAETKELHVHPESTHWFAHVEQPGTTFVAELGYYSAKNEWFSLALSAPTTTPPDRVAEENRVVFALAPFIAEEQRPKVQPDVEVLPIAHPPEPTPSSGLPERPTETMDVHRELPLPRLTPAAEREPNLISPPPTTLTADQPNPPTPVPARAEWFIQAPFMTPAQSRMSEALFAEVLSWLRTIPHDLPSSPLGPEEKAPAAPPAGPGIGEAPSLPAMALPSSPGPLPFEELPSSPAPQPAPAQGRFWFRVNAELVVYGATEPTATVTIGGRPIRLREDGTFSYRFALPDGHYQLPIMAISETGEDRRLADLQFRRESAYAGEVGKQAQDPELKVAHPEHVA